MITLEALLWFALWAFAIVCLLALLSAYTHPACGERGRGRHCNIHRGAGMWR